MDRRRRVRDHVDCTVTVTGAGKPVVNKTRGYWRDQLRARVRLGFRPGRSRRLAQVTTSTDVDPLVARMRPFGTTIFAEMSALAVRTGAVNLGQGFPDTDGPPEMLGRRRRGAARRAATSTRPARASPRCARRSPPTSAGSGAWTYDPDGEVADHRRARPRRSPPASSRLCEPGDEVVCFEPYYDSYAASIALAGAVRRPVTLRPGADGRYAFDPAELRAAFGPRTRLVLLNSPHNPTGKVFTRDELALIAELCQEHDAYAVTDEVYEHLVFTDAAAPARAAGHACPACGSGRCASRRPARPSPAPAGRSAG